jgi:ABC-2 type transport system ATP-binding protein
MSKETSLSIFQAKNIQKEYSSGAFKLHPLSMSIGAGEIIGLVGENGNGKTTLLRIIAGDLSCQHEQFLFNGQPVTDLGWENYKRSIAYIPQRIPQWYGYLKDNLLFQATVVGLKNDEAIQRVEEVIRELGLEEYSHLKWSEISSGYRLRFQLAKMLIGQPTLLVLDEPLGNLDINAQERFLGDLRRYVSNPNRSIAVVFSSQQLHEIENVSDKIIVLQKGVLKFDGEITTLGNDRTTNSYELQTTFSLEEISSLFPDAQISLYGKTIQLETDLSLSSSEILKIILSKNGEIQYFRNISSSSKKMF